MAELAQDSLATLKTPEECQAEQIRAYVDEYAALALEAGRIKDRMDWLKGYFETMATDDLKDTTDRRVLVDASIHTRSESNADYLTISQEVDDLLRPVFRFEDGGEARAITVPDVACKVVDRVLHCTFTLAFRDSIQEPPPLPYMETLDTSVKPI